MPGGPASSVAPAVFRTASKPRRVVLSTDRRMTTAQRLYERLGFTRLPERDWSPRPGIDLLVYAVDL